MTCGRNTGNVCLCQINPPAQAHLDARTFSIVHELYYNTPKVILPTTPINSLHTALPRSTGSEIMEIIIGLPSQHVDISDELWGT